MIRPKRMLLLPPSLGLQEGEKGLTNTTNNQYKNTTHYN
jgi:hypothetical protein